MEDKDDCAEVPMQDSYLRALSRLCMATAAQADRSFIEFLAIN
jgi:hypothetical protein